MYDWTEVRILPQLKYIRDFRKSVINGLNFKTYNYALLFWVSEYTIFSKNIQMSQNGTEASIECFQICHARIHHCFSLTRYNSTAVSDGFITKTPNRTGMCAVFSSITSCILHI